MIRKVLEKNYNKKNELNKMNHKSSGLCDKTILINKGNNNTRITDLRIGKFHKNIEDKITNHSNLDNLLIIIITLISK